MIFDDIEPFFEQWQSNKDEAQKKAFLTAQQNAVMTKNALQHLEYLKALLFFSTVNDQHTADEKNVMKKRLLYTKALLEATQTIKNTNTTKNNIDKCDALLNLLTATTNDSNSTTTTLKEIKRKEVERINNFILPFQEKLSDFDATKLKSYLEAMNFLVTAVNNRRLNWIFSEKTFVKDVMPSLFPQMITTQKVQEQNLKVIDQITGHLSYILLGSRFIIELISSMSSTEAKATLAESIVVWFEGLSSDEKQQLFFDLLWTIINAMSYWWLTGAQDVGHGMTLGSIGDLLNVCALLAELCSAYLKLIEIYQDGAEKQKELQDICNQIEEIEKSKSIDQEKLIALYLEKDRCEIAALEADNTFWLLASNVLIFTMQSVGFCLVVIGSVMTGPAAPAVLTIAAVINTIVPIIQTILNHSMEIISAQRHIARLLLNMEKTPLKSEQVKIDAQIYYYKKYVQYHLILAAKDIIMIIFKNLLNVVLLNAAPVAVIMVCDFMEAGLSYLIQQIIEFEYQPHLEKIWDDVPAISAPVDAANTADTAETAGTIDKPDTLGSNQNAFFSNSLEGTAFDAAIPALKK